MGVLEEVSDASGNTRFCKKRPQQLVMQEIYQTWFSLNGSESSHG